MFGAPARVQTKLRPPIWKKNIIFAFVLCTFFVRFLPTDRVFRFLFPIGRACNEKKLNRRSLVAADGSAENSDPAYMMRPMPDRTICWSAGWVGETRP